MEHGYTDEQRMLRDSVLRLLANRYPSPSKTFAQVAMKPVSGAWQSFAELGLLSLPFSVADGGLGCGGVETLIIMEAFGRSLVSEPYIPTVVMFGGLLHQCGSKEQIRRFLPGLMQGKDLYAVALQEPASRFNPANVTTSAARVAGGYRLNGVKSVVYGAPLARGIIVAARTAGSSMDESGIGLFYVASGAPGLDRRDYPTIDGMCASELVLDDLFVPQEDVIGDPEDAFPAIEGNLDRAAAAACAEAAGCMAILMDRTLDYTRMRNAFGQPVSAFQVIQHRLVDMRVACEYAAAMSYMAALSLEAPPPERRRSVSAAKAMVARDSKFVAQSALQLHGAIAMTEDLDVGLYFKRLTAFGFQFGNEDHHLRRFWAEWRRSASPSAVAS